MAIGVGSRAPLGIRVGAHNFLTILDFVLLSSCPYYAVALPSPFISLDPSQWSITETAAWLESVELGDVRETLCENSISGSELMELSEDDLKAMGISKLGLRKKLLKGIAVLRADSSAGSSSMAADSSETLDPVEEPRLPIKLWFKNDWYSIKILKSTTSFKSLKRQLEDQFECKLRIKYVDSDGDQITIKRESDWQDTIKEAEISPRSKVKLYCYPREISSSPKSPNPSKEEAEEMSPQARAELFGVFEGILDPVVIISETGTVQFVNKSFESSLGFGPADLLGSSINVIIPENIRPYHDSYLQNYLRTGVTRIIGIGRDVLAMKKDGSIFPVHLEVTEYALPNSTRLYFVGILKQTTVRGQAKSLMQQERQVLDSLNVPAIIIDSKGIINGFNKSAQEFLGYSLVDIIGKNVSILMPPPHSDHHDAYIQAYLDTGHSKIIGIGRKVIAQHSDGTLIPTFLTVSEKRDGDKRFFTGIMQEAQIAIQPTH